MKTLKALWNDEAGVIISTELILIVTILGIGLVVGLSTLRNDVVTELADTAQAISNIDQTYYFSGTTGHSASTNGSAYNDVADFCEAGAGGTNEQCVVVGPALNIQSRTGTSAD